MENDSTVSVETITPEIAVSILATNDGNRQISKSNMAYIKSQMSDGAWKFSADPIRISKSGRLLDGQHRLEALVELDKTFDFLVVRGLNEDVFDVIDTGKPRTASDVLSISGYKNASLKASIAKMIMLYQRGKYALQTRSGGAGTGGVHSSKSYAGVSNAEILSFCDDVDLEDFCIFANNAYNKLRIFTKSEYGSLYYILSKINQNDANIFFEKLVSGANLLEKDPILLLRNKFIENMSTTMRFSGRIRLLLIFRCWNYFRKGESVKILNYSQDQEIPTPI